MNATLSKLLAVTALLCGLLLLVGGATFIVIYFKDAVFMRPAEVDRSAIFWYLPFLLVGIGGLVCALIFCQSGWRRLHGAKRKKGGKK